MSSDEIRKRFLDFFAKRGHTILPSASVVPENDPSVLFTTAGMQPLVPFLLGAPHPGGTRLANIQKCIRTQDIEEVGDATHDTFFEMLGNWSLGDYFKEDAIKWSYEFLTSKEEGLGLDPQRLYITVFEGDESAPRDEESKRIWMSLGIPEHRIYFLGADSNWWPAVKGKDTWSGPTGPDTEMFYDITDEGLGDLDLEGFKKADDEQKVVEIWNDVFMEYVKEDGVITGTLEKKNVDTGAGLERMAMVLQKKDNIFDTDLFAPFISLIREHSAMVDEYAERIVADHIRTAVFMIADGVVPSNSDRGYVLRRLLRRAVRYADTLGMGAGSLELLARLVISDYSDVYENLAENDTRIVEEITAEEERFRKTLERGMKKLNSFIDGLHTYFEEEKELRAVEMNRPEEHTVLPSDLVFDLYQTYGFPFEMTAELAKERGMSVDREAFDKKMQGHQEQSRAGAEKKFKGGLADTSEASTKYHTATHLLLAALRKEIDPSIEQRGSNITPERLRFDFSWPDKLSDEEVAKVEHWVNEQIQKDLPVVQQTLPKEEAKKIAHGIFEEKYGDVVSVYSIGNEGEWVSREFCGGPHVAHTGVLGTFKITKQESVSRGVRRIKAVLE